MPFHTIVTQTGLPICRSFLVEEKKVSTLAFSYNLVDPLKFTEPHCARLLWLGGSKNPCLLFADFVERQNVNGSFEPFLASTAAGAKTGWVPLASNQIPQIGYYKLRRANLAALGAGTYTVVVEIAPLSWINGAQK